MKEWIVCADKPTRAMERMKTGELVRCRDCALSYVFCETNTDLLCKWFYGDVVEPDGFCAWGERGE